VPVLLNRGIICGSKYITEETGQLFSDEHDLRWAIEKLISKTEQINPQNWWANHYGKKQSGKILRDTLQNWYPNLIGNDVQEVYFL
jgi:hypothetical protein